MLLFLYSEDIFNKTKFNEFEELMSWDVNRFDQLLKNGWVHVWRKKRGKETTLYELTYKAKRLVNLIYRKLNGEEIGEDHRTNPLFRKDASFMDKVYRQSIIKLNEERKQLF